MFLDPLRKTVKLVALFIPHRTHDASGSDERILGFTLDNKLPLAEYVGSAKSCVCHDNPQALRRLTSGEFSTADVERQEWTMPAGAFHGAAGGPC